MGIIRKKDNSGCNLVGGVDFKSVLGRLLILLCKNTLWALKNKIGVKFFFFFLRCLVYLLSLNF